MMTISTAQKEILDQDFSDRNMAALRDDIRQKFPGLSIDKSDEELAAMLKTLAIYARAYDVSDYDAFRRFVMLQFTTQFRMFSIPSSCASSKI